MPFADWRALRLRDFSGPVPRATLMWPPRAVDVARIAALVGSGRAIDVGAGSGLLARLLTESGVNVRAIDPGDTYARDLARFFPVEPTPVDAILEAYDLAIVSWMEAGRDYRSEVAKLAPVVFQARDAGGGCGVKGDVSYAPFDFVLVDERRGPSYEDVEHALTGRKTGSENVLEVWARPEAVGRAKTALASAVAVAPFPWEAELATRLLRND